jgi:hypothetical protein
MPIDHNASFSRLNHTTQLRNYPRIFAKTLAEASRKAHQQTSALPDTDQQGNANASCAAKGARKRCRERARIKVWGV